MAGCREPRPCPSGVQGGDMAPGSRGGVGSPDSFPGAGLVGVPQKVRAHPSSASASRLCPPPALSPKVMPPCSPCVLRHGGVALLWVPWSLAYSVVCPKATGNRKAGVFGLAGSHWDLRFAFKLT